jgi:tetratricopeptide (TPR) repeat protein
LPERETASGNRHNTVFAARQALAIALRRQGQFDVASQQYEILLRGARAPGEQVGVAVNYLRLMQLAAEAKSSTQSDVPAPAEGAARLLMRLSSEPWPLEDSDSITRAFGGALQSNAALWPEVASALRRLETPQARLASAYFLFGLETALSNTVNSVRDEGQKEQAADLLRQVAAWSTREEESLPPIANGSDKVLAARAASLLAGRAVARKENEEAIRWLQLATSLEIDSVDLRLALARTYGAAGRTQDALQVRDAMLRALPRDSGTLRRIATLSSQLGRASEALPLLEEAWNLTQSSPNASGEAQTVAFLFGRALLANGQTERAPPSTKD